MEDLSQALNSVSLEQKDSTVDTFGGNIDQDTRYHLGAGQPLLLSMEEISEYFSQTLRSRSDSVASTGTESTSSRQYVRQRLAMLMTCVDDMDPDDELNAQVAKTLDEAFLVCRQTVGRPKKDQFRLYVVTWNVATAEPPDDVSSLLQLSSPKKPELFVIGLQEVKAAPLKFVTDLAFEDSWSHLFMNTLAPLGYIKVSSIRMQGLLLLFFSKLEHVPFIRDIQVTYTRTGLYGYWGNKGGVSIRLSFYGHMLCFLNCHLTAHMNYASQRVDEFEYILDAQTFDSKNEPRILDHKVVFWFGDLNFRIEDHGMLFVRNCITSQRYNLLWPKDQLTMMKQKEATLRKFEEGPLDFQPTYKFDLNSDDYDTSGKKRKPAWCDRILWRVKPKSSPSEDANEDGQNLDDPKKQLEEQHKDEFPLKLSQEFYTSKMEYGISDHKPVCGIFRLELRKMCEKPLVQVCAEGEWSADFDALITYSPLQSFPSSAWDWIGLYKVGFKSISDYITYTWVKDDQVSFSDELFQVFVNKDEIPVLGGECMLCYYSSNLQCIVGISQPFKVQESRAAIEEGLVPENINKLDDAVAS